MPNINNNIPSIDEDVQRRFKEARERYNTLTREPEEVVTSDDNQKKNTAALVNILDYLKTTNVNHVGTTVPTVAPSRLKAANGNIGGSTSPIPVKPIEPEAILLQSKTNALIDSVNNTIKRTALPQPLKIDDKNLAHEATLKDVGKILINIHESIIDFTNKFLENIKKIFMHTDSVVEELGEGTGKKIGFFSRNLNKVMEYFKGINPKFESIIDSFERVMKPAKNISASTLDYIRRIYLIQKEEAKRQGLNKVREDLTADESPGLFDGLFGVLFPKSSVIGKAFTVIENIGNLFKSIGEYSEKKLGSSSTVKYVTGLFATGRIGGAVRMVLGLFGGIGGFIASVVGSVVFASLYAMFKNPDQLVDMLGAFKNLFTEVIVPAFEWISREIIPPLAVAFAGLLAAADYLLDTVGTFINKKLIWLIGTAIPDIAKLMGGMIDKIFQGFKDAFWRIAGIFGVGEYAGEGVFTNIAMGMIAIADGILDAISLACTEFIKTFVNLDFLGLKSGESIYGRLKRFLMEDIPNFVVNLYDQTVEYIRELNPIELIKQKLSEFSAAIIGMIPSWADVKKFILDSMPNSTPDFIKNWFKDSVEEKPQSSAEPIQRNSSMLDRGNLDPYSRSSANMTIFAPQTSTTNNTMNNMSRPSGGSLINKVIGSTQPQMSRLEEMTLRAIPY